MEHELLKVAVQAAQTAGQILLDWSEKFTVQHKSGPSDLVTEADVAAQRAILDIVDEKYPDHNFLGEEGLNRSDRTSGWRWVVDPLDGTGNYVHRFPYFAVSIGIEFQGEVRVGVIYDPSRKDLFTSVRGEGAFLNGTRLSVSRVELLKKSLVIASFPPGVSANGPEIARFLRILSEVQSVQRTGSAALNLANLAAGRIDAFWSTSLHPWDMAAGILLVEEAGGRITRCDGGPFDLQKPDLLSSNGTGIHAELSALLSS